MNTSDWVGRILEHFKVGRQSLVEMDVANLLAGDRTFALECLEDLITRLQGPRLKTLLEALMEDGGSDLVPLFIKALRREQNILFQKAILFLFRNFECYEARKALADVANSLPASLKIETDRVLADFSARFRHLFYLEQWQQARGDARHIKHAGDAMMRHPHPSFRPILHQDLKDRDRQVAAIALQILHHQGDLESLDVLLTMLPKIFWEREQLGRLVQFLCRRTKKTKRAKLLDELGRLLGWSSKGIEAATARLVSQSGEDFSKDVLLELALLDHDLAEPLGQSLALVFSGKALETTRLNHLRRQHRDLLEAQERLMRHLFSAIGCIGRRHKVDDLLLRVKAYIPEDESQGLGRQLLIAFLETYRCGEGLSFLLDCLAEDLPIQVRTTAMNALVHYQLERVPDVVRSISEQAHHPLKLKADTLVAQWERQKGLSERMAAVRLPKIEAEVDIWLKGLSSDIRKEWTRTLRRLNLCYRDGLIPDKAALSHQLLRILSRDVDGDILKIGLALAGKVATTELVECLHQYQTDPNQDLAGFASNVLAHKHLDDDTKPVRSIFIIDNARMVVRSLARQLDQTGLQIGVSSNAVDGLHALGLQHYDALLVDYHMPIMNGVQFLHEARKQAIAPRRIIFMTCSREDDVIHHIRSQGVHDILHKPFKPDALLKLLAIERKQQAS